jgi:hypothetical protein
MNDCPSEYYNESGVCVKCLSPCQDCSLSESNCTSCLNNFAIFDNKVLNINNLI